jgi:FliI/YscN family ATPase
MLSTAKQRLQQTTTAGLVGTIMETVGTTVSVADFPAPLGAVVELERDQGSSILGEVIGFQNAMTVVFALTNPAGIRRGNHVRLIRTARMLRVGEGLLGRVVNSHGHAIDGRPQPMLPDRTSLDRDPPPAIERPRINQPFATGVRAIDGLLTCGQGQRLGIFAGSGVGKSTLLGMMARNADADVIVVGLIGERGREVNEFIERDLGPEALARSVLVVATSNEPALMRVHAASSATAVAEYFRDQGRNVLLVMDSITRLAMAHREIGLAAGEPPTTRGYPPSTFPLLSRLVERAGRSALGSITAFYSVLVEGDDETEPVADAIRGLLDGHVWLSRKLAGRGQYPAIDILDSISRLMNDIAPPEHRAAAATIRQLLAVLREHEDLVSIGAYRSGSNPLLDVALAERVAIDTFLRQATDESAPLDQIARELVGLAARCQAGNLKAA